MRWVDLLCRIHSPQSRRPCPGREFCGTGKAQGLSAKSPCRGSLLLGNLRASGRPFPPALLPPVAPVVLFPFFSCWQWNDVGGGTNVAARVCKQHSWRLLITPHPLPSAPWVWPRTWFSRVFPTSQEAGWVPNGMWQPGRVSAEPLVPLVNCRGSLEGQPRERCFPFGGMRGFRVILTFTLKAGWEHMQGTPGSVTQRPRGAC